MLYFFNRVFLRQKQWNKSSELITFQDKNHDIFYINDQIKVERVPLSIRPASLEMEGYLK